MATGNITRLEGVWPETHERAVRDSAGVNLETKLGNINSDISQLSAEVDDLTLEVNGHLSFTLGQISVTKGEPSASTTRAYSEKIANPVKVYFPTTIKVSPRYYDLDGTYRGYDEWSASGEVTLNTDYDIVRIVVAYVGDSTISDASAFDSIVQVECLEHKVAKNTDDISSIDTRLQSVEDDMIASTNPPFELGTIGTGGGADEPSTTRARTDYISYHSSQKIIGESGYKFAFRWYKSDGTFIATVATWLTGEKAVSDYLPSNGAKYRLVAAYSNDATISDATQFNGNIRVKASLTDIVASLADVPAEINDIDTRLSGVESSMTYSLDEGFVIGQIDATGVEYNDNTRCRTSGYFSISEGKKVSCQSGYKYSYRWYDINKDYLTYSQWKTDTTSVSATAPSSAVYFRLVAALSNDGTISDPSAFDLNIDLTDTLTDAVKSTAEEVERLSNKADQQAYSSGSSVGNCSILSAKQHTFDDGTAPLLEWYLLADPDNNLYMSRDLANKTYLSAFTGTGGVSAYAWGILPNGDVIACKMASELTSGGSDSNRVNPYVFKASEGWATQHEVDFGTSLKPCGWLESCGFTTLPDGNAMFAEYTRITVATCNCWKIVGDPLVVSNWVVKKSFTLSGEADAGFKHAHMVVVDFYTGVIYLATGDDNVGAMVFASSDGGDNWTQLREGSELWCRMLMMTFTPDYIYWGQDTPGQHYLFRAERDESGVLDYSTATQYVTIPAADGYFATYGQAYLPEYDAVLLLDRQDSGDSGQTMPIRVITLADGQIHTIGSLVATSGGQIGFRTSFSEWYPVGGLVRIGFGFMSPIYNKNKICGNKWPINGGRDSVNNLWLKVGKDGSKWSLQIGTFYL